jgi:diguanylate cyclase (GGDEF)-like protein/PAS domain S-box-containing protein
MLLEALFAAAPEPMLVVDSAGTIRLANTRAEQLFGFEPGAMAGREVDSLVPAALAGRHGRHRASYAADPQTRTMAAGTDVRACRADGSEFPVDVALGFADVEGEGLVIAIVRDITVPKRDRDELRYLSEHDALTGLYNRRGLDRQLGQALAHARRHGVPSALLLMDLDGFKQVNDRFGHLRGDRMLRDVACALRRRMRAGDTIARLGGDEFAVVARFVTEAGAEALARDLLAVARSAAAREPLDADIRMTMSVGLVPLPGGGQDPLAVIAAADRAMYEAKRAGGDAVHIGSVPLLTTPLAPGGGSTPS